MEEKKLTTDGQQHWISYIDLPELNKQILKFVNDNIQPSDININFAVSSGNPLPKTSVIPLVEGMKQPPDFLLEEKLLKFGSFKLTFQCLLNQSFQTETELGSYDLLSTSPILTDQGHLSKLFQLIQENTSCLASAKIPTHFSIPCVYLKYSKGQVHTDTFFGPFSYSISRLVFFEVYSRKTITLPLCLEDDAIDNDPLFSRCIIM